MISREKNEGSLISVVIPTYNRCHFINKAMDSVYEQTYRPIELIIVDDGSTDETKQVVEGWGSKLIGADCFELRYVPQRNKGPSSARNLGIAKSHGEYIQFLDSDDILHPEKLKIHVELFKKNPNADATVSQVAYVDQNGIVGYVTNIIKNDDEVELCIFLLQHDIPTHAPIHRREALIKIGGFNEKLTFGEEVDMHLRLALEGANFDFIPEILAYVPRHRDSNRVSRRLNYAPADFETKFYMNILKVSEKRGKDTQEFRQSIAKKLLLAAQKYYSHGKIRGGKSCILTAQVACPDSISFVERVYLSKIGGLLAVFFELLFSILERIKNKSRRILMQKIKNYQVFIGYL